MSRRDEFEITPATVLRAYSIGLFPMAESADDPTIFWVDPEARGVFPLDGLRISRSLAKTVRGDRYEIVVDRDFDAVIDACATRAGETWINPSIRRLYRALFDMRAVHTVEARAGGELVGGLYGVSIGGAFFGESMFHRARDASKVAFVHLAARLRKGGWRLLDAQFVTDHLATLGAVEIGRDDYRLRLKEAIAIEPDQSVWSPDESMSGAAALAAVRAALD
jgi:leucyl/phenylalanyl-tRNA--protein transferase